MTLKSREGSTSQLIQLCVGYFVSYVITGILVKYFTGGLREPRMSDMTYLFNNTVGGSLIALGVVLLLRWYRLKSNGDVSWGGLRFPSEFLYIIPSGVCTAVVIPTTTLMYTLPISVMVAMVIMRGSVIVISRFVDALQIRQGILKKKVFPEENWAVVFAILAVATNVLLIPVAAALGWTAESLEGSFDFLGSPAALIIMGLYIVAYTFRIYIMNYYKNTRGKGVPQDNKGFFAVEQIAACATMVAAGLFFFLAPGLFGWKDVRLADFRSAIVSPDPLAILSGVPYGMVAFFSVFIFIFKGRTATFAGLVNRLTSLLAGTVSTLILFWFFKLKPPKIQDWVSLVFIGAAVGFLTLAEKRRTAELAMESVAELARPGPALAASPSGAS